MSPPAGSHHRFPLYQQMIAAMLFGAIIGITLNATLGSNRVTLTEGLPKGWSEVTIDEDTNRATMSIRRTEPASAAQGLSEQTLIVEANRSGDGVYPSWEALQVAHPEAAAIYRQHGGTTSATIGNFCKRIGNLFLRMLQMVSVPLIITSLITGVMGLSGHEVGRIFRVTLTYYLVTSALAIVTGLVLVNLIRPGLGDTGLAMVGGGTVKESPPIVSVILEQIENVIPANPLGAIVQPNFLSIIAFSIMLAVFAMKVGGEHAARLRTAAETGFAIIMELTHAIIRYMPIGVFLLMIYVTATQGSTVFKSLGWYMLTVALGLIIHGCFTLPLIVRTFGGRDPFQFTRDMSPALLTAFSTASSNGTLPVTMNCVEERAGISNRTGSFVLPLGATINMDGTALYEAVAVMFIAQLHFGETLPLAQQVVVALTALVASVGAAGIPHAGLVMMVIVLQAVGLPLELQGIILAVDRVLDMARTTVNVWSDACGCAVVEKIENRKTERALPAVD